MRGRFFDDDELRAIIDEEYLDVDEDATSVYHRQDRGAPKESLNSLSDRWLKYFAKFAEEPTQKQPSVSKPPVQWGKQPSPKPQNNPPTRWGRQIGGDNR